MLIDHLAGCLLKLSPVVEVDTGATNNLALLEIADKSAAPRLIAGERGGH